MQLSRGGGAESLSPEWLVGEETFWCLERPVSGPEVVSWRKGRERQAGEPQGWRLWVGRLQLGTLTEGTAGTGGWRGVGQGPDPQGWGGQLWSSFFSPEVKASRPGRAGRDTVRFILWKIWAVGWRMSRRKPRKNLRRNLTFGHLEDRVSPWCCEGEVKWTKLEYTGFADGVNVWRRSWNTVWPLRYRLSKWVDERGFHLLRWGWESGFKNCYLTFLSRLPSSQSSPYGIPDECKKPPRGASQSYVTCHF